MRTPEDFVLDIQTGVYSQWYDGSYSIRASGWFLVKFSETCESA